MSFKVGDIIITANKVYVESTDKKGDPKTFYIPAGMYGRVNSLLVNGTGGTYTPLFSCIFKEVYFTNKDIRIASSINSFTKYLLNFEKSQLIKISRLIFGYDKYIDSYDPSITCAIGIDRYFNKKSDLKIYTDKIADICDKMELSDRIYTSFLQRLVSKFDNKKNN